MTVPLILPEHVAWYARNVAGRDLTDPEARCVDVICAFRKIHEWPVHHSGKPAVALLPLDGGVTGLWRGELASWDESSLTRAVIAAHHHRVRLAIRPGAIRSRSGALTVIRCVPCLAGSTVPLGSYHPGATSEDAGSLISRLAKLPKDTPA